MSDVRKKVDQTQQLLCDKIKKLRKARGWSLNDLHATFLNEDGKTYSLSKETIQNIENRKYNPKLKDILSVLYHLGANPATLLVSLERRRNPYSIEYG